ncbi:hypothetical protein L207DRAFT_533877 [Hyaloscypha variabilis F]|uniref:Uncharacterized protein n=1 Tax=Hyaloscypha variabilis (strain UAMH 11265 / GT02V1 / F) TaxID=1149755 RepID=A0A2J6R7R3_HYAVF|nr:hypothetical protein L207DRAFT_533877 [Hyaloscypha variabilis F]
MAASSQSKKSFAFVPVDKDGSHAASLSFIRSHAVRGALRQKKLGGPIASATQEIEKVPFQTGRFRILSSHTKVKTAKPKSQEGSQPISMIEEDLVAPRKFIILSRILVSHNNSLLRSDLAYAGLTLSKPYFLPTEPIRPISQVLDGSSATKHISIPFPPSTMLDILREIRVLSRYLEKDSLIDSERLYFCTTILRTQYQLTAFSAENAFRKRQSQNEEPASIFPSLFYQASTSLSLTIYINIVLRKLPLRSSLHHTIAKHVKSNLEREGLQLILTWAADLELLLWILFITAVANIDRVERLYFVQELKLVVMELRILTFEEYIKALKVIVWSDSFCFLQSMILWEEIGRLS